MGHLPTEYIANLWKKFVPTSPGAGMVEVLTPPGAGRGGILLEVIELARPP